MGQENILPGQESKFDLLASRYNVERGILLHIAGQALSNSESHSLTSSSAQPEALELGVKSRTVDTINAVLAAQPIEFQQFCNELTGLNFGLQMVGSISRSGVLTPAELENIDRKDLDIGINYNGPESTTPQAVIAFLQERISQIWPDQKAHVSYMNKNGKQFFDPQSKDQTPFAYTVEVNGTTYTFMLSFDIDPENGEFEITPNKKRTVINFDQTEKAFGNPKVPDAMSCPVDLIFDPELQQLKVADSIEWSKEFFDTLIYGNNGEIAQIVGMHPRLLEMFRNDPHLAIYLKKAAIFGQRYAFTPQMLEIIQGKILNDESKLWYDPVKREFIKFNNPKQLAVEGLIDARSLMLLAKLSDILTAQNDATLPINKEMLEQVSASAIQEATEIFSTIGEVPVLTNAQDLQKSVYQALTNMGLEDFRAKDFNEIGGVIRSVVKKYGLDIMLDQNNPTVRKVNKAQMALLAADVLLMLGVALSKDNFHMSGETISYAILAFLLLNTTIAAALVGKNMQTCVKPKAVAFNGDPSQTGAWSTAVQINADRVEVIGQQAGNPAPCESRSDKD